MVIPLTDSYQLPDEYLGLCRTKGLHKIEFQKFPTDLVSPFFQKKPENFVHLIFFSLQTVVRTRESALQTSQIAIKLFNGAYGAVYLVKHRETRQQFAHCGKIPFLLFNFSKPKNNHSSHLSFSPFPFHQRIRT